MACCVCTGEFGEEDWKVWRHHPILQEYEVIKDLGDGAFSSVVLAQSRHDKAKYVALKVVFLQSPQVIEDPELLRLLRAEGSLLQLLDHPNVVKCLACVENKAQAVLVLEWLSGGPLLDRVGQLGETSYTTHVVAQIFRQIADGLAHMHARGVLHRDLKPENCLFVRPPQDLISQGLIPTIKIIDLGMSCLYDPNKPAIGPLGSPGFVAPEIVEDAPHAPSMDVFSAGVILFILLVGRKPFNLDDSRKLVYTMKPLSSAPGLQDPRWLALPCEAKELVLGMLDYDPTKRLTIEQVVQHPWLASSSPTSMPLPDVARAAAQVGEVRRLRHETHGAFAVLPATRDGSARGKDAARKLYLAKRKAQVAQEKSSRGVRGEEGSVRGLNRMERIALSLSKMSHTRLHDAGRVKDGATPDLSVHFRPFLDRSQHGPPTFPYASVHGGSTATEDAKVQAAMDQLRQSKSTSDLARVEGDGACLPPGHLLRAIKGSFLDLLTSQDSLGESADDSRRGPRSFASISMGKDRSQHSSRDRGILVPTTSQSPRVPSGGQAASNAPLNGTQQQRSLLYSPGSPVGHRGQHQGMGDPSRNALAPDWSPAGTGKVPDDIFECCTDKSEGRHHGSNNMSQKLLLNGVKTGTV